MENRKDVSQKTNSLFAGFNSLFYENHKKVAATLPTRFNGKSQAA
jgi:hypothetical protein